MNTRTSFIFVFLVACSTFGSDDAPPGPAGGTDDGGAPGNGTPPVTGTPGRGLSVVPSSERAFIIQGQSREIPIRITRNDITTDAVAIAVAGLPAGVTVAPLVIASGATEGKLKVTVPATTPQASVDLSISASAGDGSTATGALPIFVRGEPGTIDATFAPGGLLVSETAGSATSGGTLTQLADGSMVVAATGGRIVKVDAEGKTLASTNAGVGAHLAPLADGRFLNFGGDKLVRFSAKFEPDTSFNGGTGLVTDNVKSVKAVAVSGGRAFALTIAADDLTVAVKRFSADGVLESQSCAITSTYAPGTPTVGPGKISVSQGALSVDATGQAHVVGLVSADSRGFIYGCSTGGLVTLGGNLDSLAGVRLPSSGAAPVQVVDDGASGFYVTQHQFSIDLKAIQLLHLNASGMVVGGPFTTDLPLASVNVVGRAPDGSIVIASGGKGGFDSFQEIVALRRYNANGTEDAAFVHWETETNIVKRPYGLVFQKDGRIVVLASGGGLLVLVRYWG